MGKTCSPKPLLHERTHACREYAHQISARHDRGYFEKLAHVHRLAHSELVEFLKSLRQRVRFRGDGVGSRTPPSANPQL